MRRGEKLASNVGGGGTLPFAAIGVVCSSNNSVRIMAHIALRIRVVDESRTTRMRIFSPPVARAIVMHLCMRH